MCTLLLNNLMVQAFLPVVRLTVQAISTSTPPPPLLPSLPIPPILIWLNRYSKPHLATPYRARRLIVHKLVIILFEVHFSFEHILLACDATSFSMSVLVLNEVDKLSREAQHSLRRTMEKYSASCRLILCCNSSSKVTEAIRSRCLNVRINAPSEAQV